MKKMNLTERTNQIFVELMTDPQIASRELCNKYQLTRGQLNYALQKINDSLQAENLPSIQRTKNGHFIIAPAVFNFFRGGQTETPTKRDDYVFSTKERADLIQLMLLSKEEYLSLNHFIDDLQVSRNTILRDLKTVDNQLQHYDLTLKYTRQKGYFVKGDEWNKRQLLADLLSNLADMHHGIQFIVQFANLDRQQIEIFKNRVELVEEELNVRFTGERLKVLPLLMILLIRRAQKGKLISYNYKINYRELADTKEYLAADRMIWDVDGLTENERVYMTLLLLTTNLSRGDILSAKEINKLKEALEAVISNFEKSAGVILEEKSKLLDRLLIHMRPAYYRIKYHLNLQSKFFQENKDASLFSLFYLVKEASGPLETFFEKKVPDAELFLISLFIGSHIVESTEIIHPENRKKAIIVCPNGVSIAVLLENTLSNLFPELDFTLLVSEKDFYKSDYPADLIFSAVPLKTDRKVFVVKSFLSEKEKRQLREKVIRSTALIQQDHITPEKIMAIVKKNVDVSDEAKLYDDLLGLFKTKENKLLEKKKLRLFDALSEDTIQIFNEEISWADLLDQLAKPLEEKNIVTANYVQALKEEMPLIPAYSVLRNKIALPHTVPEAGAKGVGLSLGVVKKGVTSADGIKIKTVILLASNDKEEHIDLIFEMMSLTGSEKLADLEAATSSTDIRKILLAFNQEYWGESHE
ncbi:hypothetical protein ID741_000872 [Enterococcus sp. AZ103]